MTKKRIPTSTRTRTAVSDYVLWSLEPVPLNHKDQVIRECREALAPSALQVVTYAAQLAERQRKKATSHAANPRAKPKDDADKPDDANPASSAAKPDDDATDKPDDAAPPAPPSDADAAGVVAPGGEPELLPARPHVGSDASRPRVSRKLTPDSLKCLLPPLSDDKVYLKWKSKASQIQVEFLGSLPVTSNLSLVPFAHPAGLGLCILHIGFSRF